MLHVCAEKGAVSSFLTVFEFYNEKLGLLESEEEKASLKDELKEVFNLQNKEGDTVLHIATILQR